MIRHNVTIDLCSYLGMSFVSSVNEAASRIAPLVNSRGARLGPWNARPRRKVARGKQGEMSVVCSLHRAPDEWKVFEATTLETPEFRIEVEEWWRWDVPSDKPLPWQSFKNGLLWNELDGDEFDIALYGDLGALFRWMNYTTKDVREIADMMEKSGDLDAQEATVLVLSV